MSSGASPAAEVVLDETDWLITTLRERARRHGLSLEQELSALLAAAEAGPGRHGPAANPPHHGSRHRDLNLVPGGGIYGDEGR